MKVISYNCSHDPRRWKKGSLKWKLNRQAFKNIICTISSEAQRQKCIQTLELPEWHFHVLQDSLKNHPSVLDTITHRIDKGYIFSGGGAGRDWNTLMETAKLLPQYIFKVATNALGKLTVTTDFLGISGYYTNGNDIVVVNQGDAKQAAEKIDYLMQHPDERKAMAARAQERVQDFRFENFWEKMKKDCLTIL